MTHDPEQREQRLATYDHRHGLNDEFLHDIGRPMLDGGEPVDPESGLRISPASNPWNYPIGHTSYKPHPASIAAHQTQQ